MGSNEAIRRAFVAAARGALTAAGVTAVEVVEHDLYTSIVLPGPIRRKIFLDLREYRVEVGIGFPPGTCSDEGAYVGVDYLILDGLVPEPEGYLTSSRSVDEAVRAARSAVTLALGIATELMNGPARARALRLESSRLDEVRMWSRTPDAELASQAWANEDWAGYVAAMASLPEWVRDTAQQAQVDIASQRAAELPPDNVVALRDLSIFHDRLGGLAVSRGHGPSAEQQYQAGLSIIDHTVRRLGPIDNFVAVGRISCARLLALWSDTSDFRPDADAVDLESGFLTHVQALGERLSGDEVAFLGRRPPPGQP